MSQQCGVGDFYIKNKVEITMKITLKDGSSKEYSEAKSVYEIAKDISEGLARAACAGEVDGEIVDLRTVLDKDCTLNIITASDEEGLRVIRHTASHVLAQAVKNLFPDAKITIGPAIDDGFYYDFDSQPFSREDLDALEAEMKKIIKQGHEITRFTLPREEAIKFMKEKDDEIVYLKTPVIKTEKESDKDSYQKGETAKYHLTVTQTREDRTAVNVVIKDALKDEDSEKERIKGDTIKVYYNGNEFTPVSVKSDDTSFTIETGKNLTVKDKLEVTYDAEVLSDLNKDSITNIVKAKADNAYAEIELDVPVTKVTQNISARKTSNPASLTRTFFSVVSESL